MATKLENFEDPASCWSQADDNEQVFVFRERDRHAPALIRLWAEMREKEGEPAEVCNEARETAGMMEDAQTAQGRVTLSLDAVSSFCVTLKQPARPDPEQAPESTSAAPTDPYQLRVGEIVVAGRGRPAKLVRIFTDADINEAKDPLSKMLRGMANIQLPRNSPVTVEFSMLRRAMPEEVEEYRNSGGRM
jgi:hypothetical protein